MELSKLHLLCCVYERTPAASDELNRDNLELKSICKLKRVQFLHLIRNPSEYLTLKLIRECLLVSRRAARVFVLSTFA